MAAREELACFVGALRYFTRLPVPGAFGHDSSGLERAIRYFPAVGLIVGAIGALVFALATFCLPKTVAVLLSMAATLYATGAFHEDGWTDMVDGFGGGWTPERILEIMKDSRIGSFGAVALIMMILTKFIALVETDAQLVAMTLIAGHAFSRFCSTCVLGTLPYVRAEGKSKPFATQLAPATWIVAGVTALLPVLFLSPWRSVPACVLALLATLWLASKFKRQIGGYTGDCLGATQQFAEIAFYLGTLCKFS